MAYNDAVGIPCEPFLGYLCGCGLAILQAIYIDVDWKRSSRYHRSWDSSLKEKSIYMREGWLQAMLL